jgi:hypothetical protein
MNTLVFHAEPKATTEYTTAFTGLSPRFEATTAGLFAVDPLAESDAGTDIVPLVEFGLSLGEGSRQQRPRYLYVHGEGGDNLLAYTEAGNGERYDYSDKIARSQVTRFVLGAGLRDNYLRVGFTGAADLTVTQVSFETQPSGTRRI